MNNLINVFIYSVHHYIKNLILNTISFSRWYFQKRILNEIKKQIITYRISKYPIIKRNQIAERYNRMSYYNETQRKKMIRAKNMEVIIKMAEDYNVNQHELLSIYNVDKMVLKYNGKDGKRYGNF